MLKDRAVNGGEGGVILQEMSESWVSFQTVKQKKKKMGHLDSNITFYLLLY